MTCAIRHPKLLATAAALVTALGLSSSAAAAEPSYEMISYLDSPSGRLLAAGDYDGAIDLAMRRTHKGSPKHRLIERTNLCVAYTVKRSYFNARDNCEAALETARRLDLDRSHRGFSRKHETAVAMTNRGVLRAMSGDMSGAASDFREATAMSHATKAPDRNLAHLEANVANRLAMTEAR